MANQLNDFDRLIKETYENHEYQYDNSVWDGIENELGSAAPGMLDFFKSVTTGLAVAGAIFAGMLIFSTYYGTDLSNTDSPQVTGNQSNGLNNFKTERSSEFAVSQADNISNVRNRPIEVDSIESSNNDKTEKSDSENYTADQKSTIAAVLSEAKKISTKKSNGADEDLNEKALSGDEFSTTSIKQGCTGLTINFDAPEEYGSNAKYLWNFGDGFFSNEENPTHVFNKEGIFDVSLSVTATGSGQISSNVVQAMIEVHEAPRAEFELEIHSIENVKLKEKSMNAVEIEWFIDSDKQLSKGSDVLLSIADNTKFDVELVAENAGNCSDSLRKEVHFIKAGNQFPQVYSSAYASDFAPGAIVDNGAVTDFRVFHKSSGEEVFKSSGSKGWNGKNKKGENVSKGEYQWLMVVDSENGYNVYHGFLNIR